MLLGFFDEFDVVGKRRLGKQVKGAAGLDHRKAEAGQVVVQPVPLAAVFVDVDALPLDVGDQPLHQGRGVDEAEHPVAEDRAVDEQFDVIHLWIGGQVADPLAGKGQVLGVGGDDDRVFDAAEDAGDLLAVVGDAGVGFVGENDQGAFQFLLFARQQGAEGPEVGFGVDDPGGIVRVVDDDRPGVGADGGFDSRKVELEGLAVGPDFLGDAAMVVDVEFIFDEIGRENNDFFAGVEDGLEHHVEGAAGPAGHDDLAGLDRLRRFFTEHIGHGGAGFLVAGVVHVAVHAGQWMLRQFEKFAAEGLGWFHRGIADGEVEHILGAMEFAQPCPFFEHPANPR